MKHFGFSTALLMLLTGVCQADTTWIMDRVDVATNKVMDSQHVLIGNNKVRINASAGTWILFDAGKKTMTQVLDEKKKFVVVDEATINNLVTMQAAAMESMKTKMAALPPAQRAQMEAMMGKMAPAAPKTEEVQEVKVRPLAASKQVAGHKCQTYEVLLGDKKVSENCLANRKEFELNQADIRTLEEMINFSQRMTAKMPIGGDVSAATNGFLDKDDLIPVESQSWDGASPAKYKMVFKSLSLEKIPAAQFEVPQDYVQQSMPKMQ